MSVHLGRRKDASFRNYEESSSSGPADAKRARIDPVVIDISSDSEVEVVSSASRTVTERPVPQEHDSDDSDYHDPLFLDSEKEWLRSLAKPSASLKVPSGHLVTPKKTAKKTRRIARKAVSAGNVPVVDLNTDSSSEDELITPRRPFDTKGKAKATDRAPAMASRSRSDPAQSRWCDGPGSSADEGAVTEEEKYEHTSRGVASTATPRADFHAPSARQPRTSLARSMTSDPSPERETPPPPVAPRSSRKKSRSPTKSRVMKKTDWRIEFTVNLYTEFNRDIFEDKLPAAEDVDFIWNGRYTSTAGRATYARNREGVVTVLRIDLSPKILETEDRINYTLSHEMCHLACWHITGDLESGHGKCFETWATLAMAIRQDLVISMRHSYEVNHTWEYGCVNCAWRHGRWSNSLDVERYVCPGKKDDGSTCEGRLEVVKFPAGASPTKLAGPSKSARHGPLHPPTQPILKKALPMTNEFPQILNSFALDDISNSFNLLELD